MSTVYEIRVLDVYGNLVAVVDQPIRLSYTRSVNSVGALTLVVTRDAIPIESVTVDTRIEVWRQPDGGSMTREGDGPWLVQTWAKGLSQQFGRYLRLNAVSINHLLSRRVIAAAPGSTASAKYGASDNLMKTYVRDQTGASAGTASWFGQSASRDWSSALLATPLQVGDDTTSNTPTAKDASYRNLLTTLQEVARNVNQSAVLGSFFDIVQIGTNTFQFNTYPGQRGVDRSSGATLFVVSVERGSLGGTIEVVEDWSDVATLVYAIGSGQGSARQITPWGDQAAIARSPWGLREAIASASNVSRSISATVGTDDDPLRAEAQAELRRLRPTRVLSGDLISVPGGAYGVDWGFGDKLIAEFEGESFTAMVESVTVTLEGGKETIKANVRSIQT